VLDYDSLLTQGHSTDVAVQTLRSRAGRFGTALIEKFAHHVGAGSGQTEARQIPLQAVAPGMIIMQDVRTHLGTLLVPRGFEVSRSFLERIRNFGPELLNEIVRVQVPAPTTAGL
jgi:predicted aspartyl protease